MSTWSEDFADVILAKSSPEASYGRWSALGRQRGLRGLLRAVNPRQAYVSGFEIGVRSALAILDEVRAFSASVDTHAKRGDSTQIEAPSPMGSAVGEAETPTRSRQSNKPGREM